MAQESGIRGPLERFLDWWGELDMWGRYGLSFVGAVGLIFLLIVGLNLLATL